MERNPRRCGCVAPQRCVAYSARDFRDGAGGIIECLGEQEVGSRSSVVAPSEKTPQYDAAYTNTKGNDC